MLKIWTPSNIDNFELPLGPGSWGCIHDCISAEGYDSPNECPGYDTKQSDREVPVNLELSGMLSTPLLPLFQGSLWPGVVAPDTVLSMSQIEVNCNHTKLNCLK